MADYTVSIKITADAGGAAREVGKLSDTVVSKVKSMSDRSMRHVKRLSDMFTKRLGGAIGKVKKTLLSLKSIAIGALVGWGVKRIIGDWERLSDIQEKAEAGMVQAMKSMGRYTPELHKQLLNVASSLQKVTTFGDEATIEGMKFLLTYRAITDDLLPRTAATMLDLAALMGGDTRQAANMLGKASMGLTGELRRVGITVDQDTYKMRGFIGVLEEIEKQVGGQARALARTKWGGLKQFGNVVADVKEKLGYLARSIKATIAETAMPYVEQLNDKLKKLKEEGKLDLWAAQAAVGVVGSFQTMAGAGQAFADVIFSIRAGFGMLAEKYYQTEIDSLKKEKKMIEDSLKPGALWRKLVPEFVERIQEEEGKKRLDQIEKLIQEYEHGRNAGQMMADANIKAMDSLNEAMNKAQGTLERIKGGIEDKIPGLKKKITPEVDIEPAKLKMEKIGGVYVVTQTNIEKNPVKLQANPTLAELGIKKVGDTWINIKKKIESSPAKPTVEPQTKMSPPVPFVQGIEKMKGMLDEVTRDRISTYDFTAIARLIEMMRNTGAYIINTGFAYRDWSGVMTPDFKILIAEQNYRLRELYGLQMKALRMALGMEKAPPRPAPATTATAPAGGGGTVVQGDIHIHLPAGASPQSPEDWRLITREYIVPELEKLDRG